MDKRQFLAAAAALAATPALAQTRKPGTDELGRTAASLKAKVIPRRKARTTQLFLTPPSWPNAITADPQVSGCSSSAMTEVPKLPGCWTAKARCCTAW